MSRAFSRAVITGAGSGLGRALALRAVARNWRVAVTDLNPASAEETLALVRAAGGDGFAMRCDVTSEASFDEVATRLKSEWGGVDVLINNAGVATGGQVLEAPLKQWQQAFDINVLGCVRGCRAIAPLLVAQGSGHIVNVASFAGFTNAPTMASYSATKAAVISLSETLRFEMHPHGIGVSVVCPAFFKTALIDSSRAQLDAGGNTSPQLELIIRKLMEKASVTAEDVAADVVDAIESGRFLVMTHAYARKQVLLKRLSPELFFRQALKGTRGFLASPR